MRAIITAAILCSVFQVLPGMIGAAAAQHYDCAHGPDYYRVRNVASHDHLNVRARPSSRSTRVGAIPYNGIRIKCIGPCKGRWCKVDWSGTVGWVNMRFLGE